MADKSENLKTGPLIAFVHVPKTAGSFVNACLKAAGLEGQDHIERWLNDPAKASTELPRLDWISGHVPFPRMRELLESSTDRQIRFFTTVRDPLRQIISHYNWLIELYHRGGSFYENHPPRIKEISEKIRESDNSNPREIIRNLKEFSGLFLNQQSRMVLGESNRNINERGIIKILNKYEFISSEMDLRNLINIMTNKNTYIAEEVNKSNYHFDKNVFYEKELAVFLERHHADDLRLYRILNESTRYRGKKTANTGTRTCMLVLGMHRSGTSALTRVLSLLGCDLPANLMGASPSNEAGHWESDAICKFNDRLLNAAGSCWHDWKAISTDWLQSNEAEAFRKEALDVLEQEFGASPLFVLKDPRICRLVPFWRDVLTEAGARPVAILPFRNPLEVAASLHRRNGFKPAFGHLLWLRHALEAEAASRKLPRVFLSYDSLLASWTHVSERIESQLGLALPRKSDAAKAEIESFLTDKLRHHRETPERATDDPALSRWLRDTYRILSRWSKVGEEDTDYTALDAILREFNAAVPAFANLVDAGNTATSLQQTREMVAARAASELGRLVATLLEDRSNPFLSKQARMRRAMKLVQRSGIFDAEWYLDRYQDVAENGIEPTRHYVLHGAREGRLPNGRIGD